MQKARGASLLGYLAALVVIAVGAYFMASYIFSSSKAQNLAKVKQDILSIKDALDKYKLDNNMYPSTDQGLQALVVQPTSDPVPLYWNPNGYISSVPLDPWGQPYEYTNNDGVLHIYSDGADGKQGGIEIDLTNINAQ